MLCVSLRLILNRIEMIYNNKSIIESISNVKKVPLLHPQPKHVNYKSGMPCDCVHLISVCVRSVPAGNTVALVQQERAEEEVVGQEAGLVCRPVQEWLQVRRDVGSVRAPVFVHPVLCSDALATAAPRPGSATTVNNNNCRHTSVCTTDANRTKN